MTADLNIKRAPIVFGLVLALLLIPAVIGLGSSARADGCTHGDFSACTTSQMCFVWGFNDQNQCSAPVPNAIERSGTLLVLDRSTGYYRGVPDAHTAMMMGFHWCGADAQQVEYGWCEAPDYNDYIPAPQDLNDWPAR